MTDQQNHEKIQAVPSNFNAKGLAEAIQSLAPMIEEAKKRLAKLPLKDVIEPVSGVTMQCRIATAEDLQRIIMLSTKGRIIVNTVPVRLGKDPAVSATINILTKDGYVTMPGASAAENAAIAVGEKPVLSAESRAIRRALRELGLRTEYEVYDNEESRMQAAVAQDDIREESLEQEPAEQVEKKPAAKAEKGKRAVTKKSPPVEQELEDDDDIPDVPADGDSEKEASTKEAPVKAEVKTQPEKIEKPKAKSAAAKKPATKRAKKVKDSDINIPDKALSIKPDLNHPDWPDKKSMVYSTKLVKRLVLARQESGLIVDTFIRQVLGKEQPGNLTLRSCPSDEMEMMYQFYVIQGGEHK